jgi:hypothetical protein
MASRDR